MRFFVMAQNEEARKIHNLNLRSYNFNRHIHKQEKFKWNFLSRYLIIKTNLIAIQNTFQQSAFSAMYLLDLIMMVKFELAWLQHSKVRTTKVRKLIIICSGEKYLIRKYLHQTTLYFEGKSTKLFILDSSLTI